MPSPPSTRQRSTSLGERVDGLDPLGGGAVLARSRRASRPGAQPASARADGARSRRASVVAGGCEWVISAAAVRPAHGSTAATAASRSATSAPLAAAPDEGLAVALRPGQPGGGEAEHRQAELAGRVGDGEDRLAAVGRRRGRRRPADPLAAELELRLDHRQDVAAGRDAGRDRGQHLGQRDERDVDRRQVGRERQVGGLEAAGVDALDHGHPRVLAQAAVELPVGDVEGDHVRRAALQQAVGEAAGRGADVEAVAAGDVDPERVERVGELDPAARDEARARVDDELGVRLDQLARAQRDGAVAADAHLAGTHGARRRRARRKEAALSKHSVDSGLLHGCNGTGKSVMCRDSAVFRRTLRRG